MKKFRWQKIVIFILIKIFRRNWLNIVNMNKLYFRKLNPYWLTGAWTGPYHWKIRLVKIHENLFSFFGKLDPGRDRSTGKLIQSTILDFTGKFIHITGKFIHISSYKQGCVVRMVVDSILLRSESGPNDHRKDAPLFTVQPMAQYLQKLNRYSWNSHE